MTKTKGALLYFHLLGQKGDTLGVAPSLIRQIFSLKVCTGVDGYVYSIPRFPRSFLWPSSEALSTYLLTIYKHHAGGSTTPHGIFWPGDIFTTGPAVSLGSTLRYLGAFSILPEVLKNLSQKVGKLRLPGYTPDIWAKNPQKFGAETAYFLRKHLQSADHALIHV